MNSSLVQANPSFWTWDETETQRSSELTLVQGSSNRGVKTRIQQWKSTWALMMALSRDTLGKLYTCKSVLLDFDT